MSKPLKKPTILERFRNPFGRNAVRMPVERELTTALSDRPDAIEFGKKLVFENDRHSLVGEVFEGYVHFMGEGRKKVAIKRINLNSLTPNSILTGIRRSMKILRLEYTPENLAREYNEVIAKLRTAGIELPKMKAIVWNGELLLVSQYFGNKKGSKLEKQFDLDDLIHFEFEELSDNYAKMINAGIVPTTDSVERIRTPDFLSHFLTFDLDSQVEYELYLRAHPNESKKTFAYLVRERIINDYIYEYKLSPKCLRLFRAIVSKISDRYLSNYLTEYLNRLIENPYLVEYVYNYFGTQDYNPRILDVK